MAPVTVHSFSGLNEYQLSIARAAPASCPAQSAVDVNSQLVDGESNDDDINELTSGLEIGDIRIGISNCLCVTASRWGDEHGRQLNARPFAGKAICSRWWHLTHSIHRHPRRRQFSPPWRIRGANLGFLAEQGGICVLPSPVLPHDAYHMPARQQAVSAAGVGRSGLQACRVAQCGTSTQHGSITA